MTFSPVSARASWMAMEGDPAGPAQHQQRFAGALALRDRQPVEQHLPGGQGGERQGGGIGMAERGGLAPDDPLIDQLQLGVGALAVEHAGVEHRVAGAEEAAFRPGRLDDAGGVVAEHHGLLRRRLEHRAALGVARVHRDGVDPDQQLAAGGRRGIGEHQVLQGARVADRQAALGVADRLHGVAPGAGRRAMGASACVMAARWPPFGIGVQHRVSAPFRAPGDAACRPPSSLSRGCGGRHRHAASLAPRPASCARALQPVGAVADPDGGAAATPSATPASQRSR